MGKWRLLILIVAVLFTAGCAGNNSFDSSSRTSEDTATLEAQGQNGDDDSTRLSPLNDDLDDDRDDELEFTGRVDAVNDDGSYTIDGQTVFVDDDTVLDDFDVDALGVGMWVKVEARRGSDGSLIADEIELEDDLDDMDDDRDDDIDDDRDDDVDDYSDDDDEDDD